MKFENKSILGVTLAVFLLCGLVFLTSCSRTQKTSSDLPTWNAKSAAAYLDQREKWWMNWPKAARGNGTFCVSCHTAVPYAISRPALQHYLGETNPSESERALLENVAVRVHDWKEIQPFYTDQHDGANKTAESKGTEAVLNALILVSYDQGKPALSEDTRKAFDIMWDEQVTKGQSQGAWSWLQLDNEPWEAPDSEYYGAALAAVAVGMVPTKLQSDVNPEAYVSLLRDYLKRGYSQQPLLNRVVVLWASSGIPDLLTAEQKSSLTQELLEKQERDGGWNIASMAWTWSGWHRSGLLARWRRADGTWQPSSSDGYATALIVLSLLDSGVPPSNNQLQRARIWLVANQSSKEGDWPSSSLNQHFRPSSDFALFMSDAATAYAALALIRADSIPNSLQTRCLARTP